MKKEPSGQQSVFEVTGIHCSSCGMAIDDAVEELAAVKRSATDVRRRRTTVEWAGEVDERLVIDAIRRAGYQASPPASPDESDDSSKRKWRPGR